MSEPLVDLDAIFNLALKETEELMQLGFDISDPCAVTSLEWYANKYPEIAEKCNHALLTLIEKQAVNQLKFEGTIYSDKNLDSF